MSKINCSEQEIFCYGNVDDNSIRNYLSNISQIHKQNQLEIILDHYSLVSIEIKRTKYAGLGVFLKENLQKGQSIFQHDFLKMISSRNINFKFFFHNSLSLQHKLYIPKKQMYALEERFKLNVLYHFSNIQNSFLRQILQCYFYHILVLLFDNFKYFQIRGDLLSLPFDQISPILHLSLKDVQLLKNDISLYDKIFQTQKNIKKSYYDFIKNLQKDLSKEIMQLLFQRDNISMQEYILVEQWCNSRTHKRMINSQREIFMIPILHYVNQFDSVQTNQFNSFQELPKKHKKYILVNQFLNFANKQEFRIFYGYQDIDQIANWSGFVPWTFEPFCIKISESQLQIGTNEICLNSKNFNKKLYQFSKNLDNHQKYQKIQKFVQPTLNYLQLKLDQQQKFTDEIQKYILTEKSQNNSVSHIEIYLNLFKFKLRYLTDLLLNIYQSRDSYKN